MLCVPLLAPGLDALFASPGKAGGDARKRWLNLPRRRYERGLARELRGTSANAGTLIVLDLPAELGAQIAATLAADRLAHAVLFLGRWPYTEAVLPAEPLLTTLISEAGRLTPLDFEPRRNVIVVLDGERSRRARRGPGDPRADNRYEIGAEDLPDAATLAAAQVGRVLDVRARDADIPAVLRIGVYPAYERAGLRVERFNAQLRVLGR